MERKNRTGLIGILGAALMLAPLTNNLNAQNNGINAPNVWALAADNARAQGKWGDAAAYSALSRAAVNPPGPTVVVQQPANNPTSNYFRVEPRFVNTSEYNWPNEEGLKDEFKTYAWILAKNVKEGKGIIIKGLEQDGTLENLSEQEKNNIAVAVSDRAVKTQREVLYILDLLTSGRSVRVHNILLRPYKPAEAQRIRGSYMLSSN